MVATDTRLLRTNPDAITAEQVDRELARRSLTQFGIYMLSWWRATPLHELVASYLEQVEEYARTEGKTGIGRLMVLMEPRVGKTVEVSQLLPPWCLGRNPNKRVILTSYAADLAVDNSAKARAIIDSNRYSALFGARSNRGGSWANAGDPISEREDAERMLAEPVELSEDSRAKANWDLAEPFRGGVVAVGVGGGLTGKGAHWLIIDDPFKNREEAESQARRDLVWEWYTSSAYTRLEKGGAIVLMQTRWHRDDLAGRLMKAMASDPKADQWTIVSVPATALGLERMAKDIEEQKQAHLFGVHLNLEDPLKREPGKAAYPEKYDEKALEVIRANVGEYDWWSLFQQMPTPAEGGFFNEKGFKIIEPREVPDGLQWFRYVDPAIGKNRTNDFNATIATAMDENTGMIYYRDMLRVQELDEFLTQMRNWMLSPTERGTRWFIEDVSFQEILLRDLFKDPQLASVSMGPLKPEGDKVARARIIQTRCNQGLVFLVRGEWIPVFLQEILEFPKGKHDDQVDTASGGLEAIAKGSSSGIYV